MCWSLSGVKMKNVKAVFIRLPIWLRWAKRFVKLEFKVIPIFHNKIKGQKYDVIVYDEYGSNKTTRE